jgi:SAM-dependent methyltransferase
MDQLISDLSEISILIFKSGKPDLRVSPYRRLVTFAGHGGRATTKKGNLTQPAKGWRSRFHEYRKSNASEKEAPPRRLFRSAEVERPARLLDLFYWVDFAHRHSSDRRGLSSREDGSAVAAVPERAGHWNRIYGTKRENEVSWFQPRPELSLALIHQYAPQNASIIDIGGGASSLTAELLREGYGDFAVLDISAAALERAKANLVEKAPKIEWIVADITAWKPARQWQVWHDRAVFHFLTDSASQDAYIRALDAATLPGAIAIISGFAPDGPEKCSGLPVVRYDAKSLATRLGQGFELLTEKREAHETPGGSVQNFYYAVLRKR